MSFGLHKQSSDDGSIRITSKGQPNIIDIIQVQGGEKNPRDTWPRIVDAHPAVLGKCVNCLFSCERQRETPVARTKEDSYYILGLLPGAIGNKYREQAANAA